MSTTTTTTTKPTLWYFNGPGRAQICRSAFVKGGVDFEDKRLTQEEFGALKSDPSSVVGQRFGSVPILDINGLVVAQSIACAQYAADLGINANVTPQQRAVDMQLTGTHADLQTACYKCLFGDDASKAAGKAALPAQAAKYLSGIERILPSEGFVNGGGAPTLGDIVVHNIVSSPFPGLIALGQSIDEYPKVKALVAAVEAYKPSSKDDEKKYEYKDDGKYAGKPVLTYFAGAGRAEITRLCFHAGGVAFEDNRLTSDEFKQLKGDKSSIVCQRFGSVPILQHGDLHIAQSMACAQYAADLGINNSVTPEQRAVDMQLLGCHADVQSAMYKCLFGSDESKAAGLEALPAAIDKFFSGFERIYPGSGFLHGGEAPTLGDMCVFDLVTSAFPGVLALGQSIDKYTKIAAVVEAVKTFGPLQKYLNSLKSPPTFHYFGVKSRAFGAVLGAAYWGKKLKWEKYNFAEWKANKNDIKSDCPFGQLPILNDGGYIVPQSNAIVRYLGKKWGKEGSTMADYALSETLIEESNDIMNIMGDAKYRGGTDSKKDSVEAWGEALAKMPKHWTNLEKLMTGKKFANETVIGEMSLFASISCVLDNDPNSLDNHQNLKAWFDVIASNAAVQELIASSWKYYKMPEQKEEKEGDIVLHYFGIKARGFPVALAAAFLGKTNFKWEKYSFDDWKNNKNDIRSLCPFGQLPVLVDGPVSMAQSMAIARYVAKKWNIDGYHNEKILDFAMCNTLIEESNDLFKRVQEAKKLGNTIESHKAELAKLPKHFTALEKLMTGGKFLSKICMGDFCLFHAINILMDISDKVLDGFDTLKAWYDGIASNPDVQSLLAETPKYFVMPSA